MKSILDIVKDNSKYTDDEAADINIEIQRIKHENEKKARAQLHRNQEIANYTDIPSTITAEDINQKTESHPHFKDYDHSLEMKRNDLLGLKKGKPVPDENGEIDCGDGITMGNLTSKDVL